MMGYLSSSDVISGNVDNEHVEDREAGIDEHEREEFVGLRLAYFVFEPDRIFSGEDGRVNSAVKREVDVSLWRGELRSTSLVRNCNEKKINIGVSCDNSVSDRCRV